MRERERERVILDETGMLLNRFRKKRKRYKPEFYTLPFLFIFQDRKFIIENVLLHSNQ